MTDAEILSHVDHTVLTAVASWGEIKKLCEEALANRTASVCIPPSYVRRARDAFGGALTICTVIGFPLGYDVTASKVKAAEKALEDGAEELDMVINLGDVKNGAFDKVEAEIAALKKVAGDHILKVIVEACYLTEDEKLRVCGSVTNAGADYIKTSTGFGTGGATMEDVLLFRENIGCDVRIKAAGGIRTREDMVAFLEAGCDRLGTSSAIKILAKQQAEGY